MPMPTEADRKRYTVPAGPMQAMRDKLAEMSGNVRSAARRTKEAVAVNERMRGNGGETRGNGSSGPPIKSKFE